MKIIFKLSVIVLVLLTVSCTSDPKPNPEPDPDFSEMVAKVKQSLTSYQTAVNKKDWQTILDLTTNTSNIVIDDSALTSDIEDKSKLTIALSNIKETLPSTVNSGKITFTGDYKETESGVSTSPIVKSTKFTATFTCSGDKTVKENWKLDFKFNN